MGGFKVLYLFIGNADVANDNVKVNGSELAITGANIDTVMVAYDGMKYIDWANLEEVNADESWFADLI